jgi:hypothetical protein
MSRSTNWARQRGRDVVRRNGGESARGGMPAEFLPPPRPRPSKAALRSEAENLVAEFEKNKIAAFRNRARATADRLKTNLVYSKDDAVGALWRYAKDNGVLKLIDETAVQTILTEAGL